MSDYLETVIQQARDADADRGRSRQKELGWSDMSGCRSYLGFELEGAWASNDVDSWGAIRGTALHDWWTDMRQEAYLVQEADHGTSKRYDWNVEVTYGGVMGHVDEVDYDAGEITDLKTTSLRSARLYDDEAVLDERFIQPMGYAAGLMEGERFPFSAPLVRLLVAPVDGTFTDWRVYERTYDYGVVKDALERLANVKERLAIGEPLPKDKPLYFCEKWCEFFSLCRGERHGPDDLEEITDPELATALERYGMAMEAAGEAKRAQELYGGLIRGMRGQARGWSVTMGRGGEGKQVPDLDAIEQDYALTELPMPMKWKPGSAPSLNVRRAKE